ncbi:MAG: M57 family metalloprotease [Sediminicola sp.]|mgnify:CR=1 FL=1|tara:strand:+ start:113997 stop:115112 length:1116 start_codon:yes stop_codon:yes gene_type:complete
MKTNSKIIIPFLVLILVFSCTKDETEKLITPESSTESLQEAPETIEDLNKKVFDYIISLGVKEEDIVELPEAYVAEGDIFFRKDMVVPPNRKLGEGLDDHLYTGNLVTYSRRRDIRVFVNSNMNTQSAEVNAAITLWNNADSHIRFRRVTSSPYDILIEAYNLGTGICGAAYTPSSGNPGNPVRINIPEVDEDNFAQRTVNIAHELGHTIGFMHTNGLSNNGPTIDVPGWAGADAGSIMNGSQCHDLSTILSARDIGALRSLYPNPHPTATSANIQTEYNEFRIAWTNTCTSCNHNAIENIVSYSGHVDNMTSFGGDVILSSSAVYYTVPGATPSPSSDGNYIQATVKRRCAHGTFAAQTITRYKSGGVWQ